MAKAKQGRAATTQSLQRSRVARPASNQRSTRKVAKKARTKQFEDYSYNISFCESESAQMESLPRRFRPKEHWESTYIDSRVYIPTLDDFSAEADNLGSMLDEVSLLPVEDLASLLCGNRIYSMIRNSVVGMSMLELCRELKEKHCQLNLHAVANDFLVRKYSAHLVLSDDCTDEFLSPSGICFYFEHVLRLLVSDSHWKWKQRRSFSKHLSELLSNARTGTPLVDASFYKAVLWNLTSVDPYAIQQTTGLPSEEVTELIECLLANAMRFFVLYCVHALRDQVVTKFSKSGEPFFRLKNLDPTAGSLFRMGAHSADSKICFCVSNEIAHLPVPQITRLVLGERLFSRLEVDFPVFIAQMHEYARLLKFTQSRIRHGRVREFMLLREVKIYAREVLSVLCDWVPLAKREQLVRMVSRCLHRWIINKLLFRSDTFDCESFEHYYVLRRFCESNGSPHSLPNALLKEISRRFDHFFLVYVVHALREHAIPLEGPARHVKFRFRENYSEDAFRTDILAPDDPDAAFSAPRSCTIQPRPAFDTSLITTSSEAAHQPEITSSDRTASITVPSATKPEATPRVEMRDVATEEIANKEGYTDEEWEMKLFEQVKQDSSVPPYFKTTFGILVANNRNLRDEKSFLHSQLGLS
ncbi:hypothetical protein Aduo_001104 [Ancylostoma duodenale]